MEELQKHTDKFARYVEQEQLISPKKKIIVLVSGGKDSNALITLLEEYRKQHELNIHYLNVMFPQDLFGKDLIVRQQLIGEGLKNYTSVIPEEQEKVLAKTSEPCRLCKDIREREIGRILEKENKEDLIIMTGHTQDDIYAYFAEITGMHLRAAINTPDYHNIQPINICLEHLEHLSRFFPKLTLHEGTTLIKPLLGFNNKEIEDILRITNKQKHTTCCMYYCNRPKRNLFHIMKLLPEKERTHIHEETSTKKLLRTIQEHAHNYEWAIDAIKQKPYKELLL